jgi:hypothetical protein
VVVKVATTRAEMKKRRKKRKKKKKSRKILSRSLRRVSTMHISHAIRV